VCCRYEPLSQKKGGSISEEGDVFLYSIACCGTPDEEIKHVDFMNTVYCTLRGGHQSRSSESSWYTPIITSADSANMGSLGPENILCSETG